MQTTKKPVIHVTVDGEALPVRFGMAALFDFCEAAGLSLGDLQGLDMSTLGLKTLGHLYWAGFKDGHRKEGRDFDLDVYDVADVMDELSEEDSAAILHLYSSSAGSGDARGGAEGKPKGKPKATAKR
jgi:hypothetical protein